MSALWIFWIYLVPEAPEVEVQLQEVIQALHIPLDCNQFSEKFVEFLFD